MANSGINSKNAVDLHGQTNAETYSFLKRRRDKIDRCRDV